MDMPTESARPRLAMFRHWLKETRHTGGAASTSGLGAAIVAELPAGARRVVGLGGGTGGITDALLGAGVPASGMLVLELNEELYTQLRTRFPGMAVLQGDARDLRDIAWRSRWLDGGAADAVVSSLGLHAMARESQRVVLEAAFACLRPDGVFVQFTHGAQAPVAEEVARAMRLQSRRSDFVPHDGPSATICIYTRKADA